MQADAGSAAPASSVSSRGMPKKLETGLLEWEIPRVTTAKVDDRKRVRIPDAKPGQVFSIEPGPEGSIVLRKLQPVEPPPANVRLEKRNGYTVAVSDRPIDEDALKRALEEFP